MSVLVFAILHPDMLLDRLHKGRLPIDHEIRAPKADGLISANKPGLKSALEPYEPVGSLNKIREEPETPMESQSLKEEQRYFYTRNDMLIFTKRRVQSGTVPSTGVTLNCFSRLLRHNFL